MAIRNVLVHVADDSRCADRIGLACDLAEQNDSRVTGLFVRPYPIIPPAVFASSAAAVVKEIEASYDAWEERCKETFDEAISAKAAIADWRVDRGATDVCLAFHAHYADIVVVGQAAQEDVDRSIATDLGGTVALEAGRPVLLMPHEGSYSSAWKRIMIAWDSSRAATRAVHDAMDFLKAADQVDVLCIDAEESADHDPGADIAGHLARHGVPAQAHRRVSGDLSTTETLIATMLSMKSDLLVMGAYGHSRLGEIVFGGVTHNIQRHASIPVLMSN